MSLSGILNEPNMVCTSRILEMTSDETSQQDRDACMALHYAAEKDDVETIKNILELNSSLVDCQDQNGFTALLIASMNGSVGALKLLIENGSQINHVDKDKHSAVHWAVVCGQLDSLIILLDNGAKVDSVDSQGAQAVHYVTTIEDISAERCEAILHILLKHNAKANVRDMDGRTPILWAASNGNLDIMIRLAQAGGDLYAIDKDQLCVMHCAASHGHENVIDYLIKTVDSTIINSTDRNGDTPLFYAVTLGHYNCARLLLLHGAEPNHQDRHLCCPSHCAAAKGQLRMLKLLKHFGGSFEIQNRGGDLPLHEAIQAGAKDCVDYLVTLHPSSVDVTNHEGRTGLHLAAASGNVEMVILLCNRNATINSLMLYKDSLFTPLDLANEKNHDLIVDYLRLRQGAKFAMELPEETRLLMKPQLEHKTMNVSIGEKQQDAISMKVNRMFDSVDKLVLSNTVNADVTMENASQETQTMAPEYKATATNTSRPSTSSLNHQTAPPVQQLIYLPKATSTTDLEQYLPISKQQKNKRGGGRNIDRENGNVSRDENDIWTGTYRWSSGDEVNDEETCKKSERKSKVASVVSSKTKGIRYQKDLRGNVSSSKNGERRRIKNMKYSEINEKWDDDGKQTSNTITDHETITTYTDDNDSQPEMPTIVVNGSNEYKQQQFNKSDIDDFERKLKKSVGTHRIDIYRNEADLSTTNLRPNKCSKKIGECYAHERAIFDELTHLKKMQLQYGKVKEQVLVRSLINNFCKMHDLDSARFKFQTFHAWEKFLHDQLKLLYAEERNLIMGSGKVSHPTANKFQIHLQRAQAVPLNIRLEDVTHTCRNTNLGTITEGSRSTQSDQSKKTQCSGEKRCNCLYYKRNSS